MRRGWSAWCARCLALAGAFVLLPAQAETVGGDIVASRPHQPVRQIRPAGLEDRVELVARELDLDAAQRVHLKNILENQRAEVARVWSDNSVAAAIRIASTQAVSDRTADSIRAMLSDDQRNKYIRPRLRDTGVGAAGGSVESWMNAAGARSPDLAGKPATKGE